MIVATRPLNAAARSKADAASAKAYSPKPKPGDPDYVAFRKFWMGSYAAAGGAIEEKPVKPVQEVKQARAAGEAHAGRRGAVALCPGRHEDGRTEPAPSKLAFGKPAASKPAPPPAAAEAQDCDCKLNGLTLACSHGRKASGGLLMVVPDGVGVDTISVTPLASGPCASTLVVRADGQPGYPKKGTAPSSFGADAADLDSSWVFSLKSVAPTSIFVSAEAGGGGTQIVRVDAYPSKKASLKIEVSGLIEKYKNILACLPIEMGGKRQPMRKMSAAKGKNWESKEQAESISAEVQWVEDKGSHRAYCEMSLNGSLDPVLAFGASYPLLGVPVPPVLSKHIKAGIYLNVDFSASVSTACAWAFWPEANETRWNSFKVEAKGAGSAELAAELLVCSPDVLQCKAAGKTELSIKGWGEKEGGEHPAVVSILEFKPLTVAVVVRFFWDLVEVEHSWQIFKSITSHEAKHVFGE